MRASCEGFGRTRPNPRRDVIVGRRRSGVQTGMDKEMQTGGMKARLND